MRDQRDIIVEQTLMILVRRGVDQATIDEVKAKLEIELAKCEVYIRSTELVAVDKTPFQHLQDYLNVKRIEGKSENTIKRYDYEIGKLLSDIRKPLDEITTSDLRLYLEYRKQHANRKPLSNRTIDNMRQVYNPFFAWLTAERIIQFNPCLAVHPIKYCKSIRKSFGQVEMQMLREACNNIRDIAMIDWFASTGCRVEEVATTMLSMIDWQERSCIVVGKGNKERKVYFDAVTAMHVKQYLNTRSDVVDALFIGHSGAPLTKSGIQQAIRSIGERAGIAKTHCHRFRHTLATNLSGKMPLTEVAEILGHDNISTTQIYCHADPTAIIADYKRAMA